MRDWIQIFKAGAYPGKVPVTVEDLQMMAATYDPAKCEAPLVLGHPELDAPAHGWVEKLRVLGDTLWAKAKQVAPELRRMVREGAFKHISMAIYTDFEGTGKPYLRHVGFLGAEIPSVKGMAAVKFAEGSYQAMDMQMPIADALDREEAIGRILDGGSLMMDRICSILADDTIGDKKQAILDQVDSLRNLVEAEQFSEGKGGAPMTFWEKLKALFAEAKITVPGEEGSASPAAGQFSEDQVREREEAAAKKARTEANVAAAKIAQAQAVHGEVTAFVDAGIRAGTFLPAWKEAGIPAVLERAIVEDAKITFAEGKPERKVGDILMELFKSLPKIVEFAEIAKGAGNDPEAALKAEFAAGQKIHDQMGVTFEMWKKARATKS